jgi:hypothetical protein
MNLSEFLSSQRQKNGVRKKNHTFLNTYIPVQLTLTLRLFKAYHGNFEKGANVEGC